MQLDGTQEGVGVMIEYITINQAAELLGTNYTTVWRRIKKKLYTVRERPSEKQVGKIVTDINIASLPADVQAKLVGETNQIPSVPFAKETFA